MRPAVPYTPLRPRRQVMLPLAIGFALITLLAVASPSYASRVDSFVAELSAEAEVPTPGPEGATGSASILIDLNDELEDGPLCYELSVEGLDTDDAVTAAHIHAGEAGVAGDVIMPLFTEPPSGEMTGCVADADLDVLAAIVANPGQYYVNVHTEAYPDGAVRGQLDYAGVPTGPSASASPGASTLPDAAMAPKANQAGGTPLAVLALLLLAVATMSTAKLLFPRR